MGVLSDTMRMGASQPSAEDDSYVIKNSIRFDSETGKSQLKRLGWFRDGTNPQLYDHIDGHRSTLSFWVKRTEIRGNDAQVIFGNYWDGNTNVRIGFDASHYLYIEKKTSGVTHTNIRTDRRFRDHGAWINVCVVTENNDSIEKERVKLYINGEKYGARGFTSETYPDQGRLDYMMWTDDKEHRIGNWQESAGGSNFEGYVTDVYWIDQCLHPACFGEFNSAGVWVPKEFALPQPNNGTTWSSGVTYGGSSTKTGHEVTKGFDGYTDAGIRTNAPGNNGLITFTPSGGISYSSEIRAYNGSGSATMHSATWSLNGGTSNTIAAEGWITIASGSGTLTTLSATRSGDGEYFSALEVDGVMLVDGKTDPTELYKQPLGKDFSASTTGTFYSSPNRGALKAFEGYTESTTYAQATDTDTYASIDDLGLTGIVKLRLCLAKNSGGDSWGGVKINSTDITSWLQTNHSGVGNSAKWIDVTSQLSGTTLTSVAVKTNGNDDARLAGVEVNNKVIVNNDNRNRYHLKMHNTSNIAGDYLPHAKVEKTGAAPAGSGGYPTYDTTDDYGEVKDSGVRTDSNSGDLKLSISQALDDISSSNHTVTNNGVIVDPNDGRFYGTALYFDASSDMTLGSSADFVLNAQDFTIEFWAKPTGIYSGGPYVYMETSSGSNGWSIQQNYLDLEFQGASLADSGAKCEIMMDQWQHFAITRDQSESKTYLWHNGNNIYEGNVDCGSSDNSLIIGGRSGGSYRYKGWMQDIRIYKGTCKYTSNFVPPFRADWTLKDMTAVPSNNGTIWTTSGTVTGNSTDAGKQFSRLFDGDTSTYAEQSGNDVTLVWTPSPPIRVNKTMRIYFLVGGDPNDTVINGDVSAINVNPANGWTDVTVPADGMNFTKLEMKRGGSGVYARASAIEIDGDLLVDNRDGDVFKDSPTNSGTDTGVGGEVNGNYCVLSDRSTLPNQSDVKGGGLDLYSGHSTSYSNAIGTFPMYSGKWYFEAQVNGSNYIQVGIIRNDKIQDISAGWGIAASDRAIAYQTIGKIVTDGGDAQGSLTAATANQVVGVAIDMDAGTAKFYVQNTQVGSTYDFSAWKDENAFVAGVSTDNTGANPDTIHMNFGQRRFAYTAPSGYKCLCTQNLSDTFSGDNKNNPSKHFDILKWTGDGVSGRSLSDLNFKPGLIWMKDLGVTEDFIVADAVRGSTNYIWSNSTADAEVGADRITSFDSDGITFGADSDGRVNDSSANYVAWCWNAGSGGQANTNGSINVSSPDQWVNDEAGFSITRFTGTGANATFGHGLSSKPHFLFIKCLSVDTKDWTGQHISGTLGSGRLILNENYANSTASAATYWNSTAPTDSLIHIGDHVNVNSSSATHICYAWRPIDGYSRFGYYEGTGSAEGPLVICGFKPKMVMIKCLSHDDPWWISDSKRDLGNEMNKGLKPDTNEAEAANNAFRIDYYHSGFKIRNNDADFNTDGRTYLYCAWAEQPLKTARAR